jgi:hypothetical protein
VPLFLLLQLLDCIFTQSGCGIVPGCPVQAESDPCVLSEGLAQAVLAVEGNA